MKTLFTLLYIGLILVFARALPCAAGWVIFTVEKDPEWNSDQRSYCFRMLDGSLAPSGLYVQILNAPSWLLLDPPTTNSNYTPHVPGGRNTLGHHTFVEWPSEELNFIIEYRMNECQMGVDILNQGYPMGDGCVCADLDGDDERYGWLRAFSYSTITGAAYYGDTQARPLIMWEWYDYWDTTNFFITTVNPAYIIPDFSLASAFSSHYEQTTLAISGHVGTVAGIDNNRLNDSAVTVHWWCVAVTNYLNHTTVTNSGVIPVFGGGTWTGQIELVRYQPFDYFGTTNTLFLRAIGASPRPEFPRSYDIMVENLITVPEPCPALLTLLLPFICRCVAGSRARPQLTCQMPRQNSFS